MLTFYKNYAVLFLLNTSLLFSFANDLQIPKEPTVPVVAGTEDAHEKKTSPNKKSPKDKKHSTKVEVILGNKKKLVGKIEFPNSIVFEHTKDRLVYKKTLTKENIKRITIKSYAMTVLRKQQDGTMYSFVPNKVFIETKEETSYVIDELFDFLKQFSIHTKDGYTTVFAYFADTWNDKQGWSEINEKDFEAHKKKGHPLAAVEWIFD